MQAHLATPVVPAVRGLGDAGPVCAHGHLYLVGRRGGDERPERKALRLQPLFLSNAILNDVHRRTTRAELGVGRDRIEDVRVNLLDFECDHVAPLRQVDGRGDVIKRRRDRA